MENKTILYWVLGVAALLILIIVAYNYFSTDKSIVVPPGTQPPILPPSINETNPVAIAHTAFITACLAPENGNTTVSCEQAWGIAQGLGISTWAGWVEHYNSGSRKVRI